jgi:hypothetical protein
LFPSANHTDERDDFGILEGPTDQQIEHLGVLAEQVRGHFDDDMAAGEHLPSGQFPI